MTSDTRHLCDVRKGWRSVFFGQSIVLVPDDGSRQHYVIALASIKPGDVLPRDTDQPMRVM